MTRTRLSKTSVVGVSGLSEVAYGGLARGGPNKPLFPTAGELPIISAQLGEPVIYEDSVGDDWNSTWADDGNLYLVSNDGYGFKNACDSHLSIHRVTGELPPNIKGTTINPMSEYGDRNQHSLVDDGHWNAGGLTCVDGVLYLAVLRMGAFPYVFDTRGPDYWIQEAWDASIIKSVDYGKTWSAQPKIGQAMFPGRSFCFPCFVEYGKNSEGHKDEFVYAVSQDGSWNNASSMNMGRVPRERIGRLDATDWEFFHGFDDDKKPIWRPRHDTARAIFRRPGRVGEASIYYNAPLDVYILPQWSRVYTSPLMQNAIARKNVTHFEFYQARYPWGPWTLFHEQTFAPEGFYDPVIPSKFVSKDGRKFWIFTAGNPAAKTLYRLIMLPVTLEVGS